VTDDGLSGQHQELLRCLGPEAGAGAGGDKDGGYSHARRDAVTQPARQCRSASLPDRGLGRDALGCAQAPHLHELPDQQDWHAQHDVTRPADQRYA
jgi:hypothetical protein